MFPRLTFPPRIEAGVACRLPSFLIPIFLSLQEWLPTPRSIRPDADSTRFPGITSFRTAECPQPYFSREATTSTGKRSSVSLGARLTLFPPTTGSLGFCRIDRRAYFQLSPNVKPIAIFPPPCSRAIPVPEYAQRAAGQSQEGFGFSRVDTRVVGGGFCSAPSQPHSLLVWVLVLEQQGSWWDWPVPPVVL